MNAYVLLTLLTAQPSPSPEDLTVATLIVRWLTKQQNSHGGFSSTQVGDFLQSPHAVRGLEQEMQEQSKGKGEQKQWRYSFIFWVCGKLGMIYPIINFPSSCFRHKSSLHTTCSNHILHCWQPLTQTQTLIENSGETPSKSRFLDIILHSRTARGAPMRCYLDQTDIFIILLPWGVAVSFFLTDSPNLMYGEIGLGFPQPSRSSCCPL